MRIFPFVIVVALVASGCAGVPRWVRETPEGPGVYYSVGKCSSTYFLDLREEAAQEAREAMVKKIRREVSEHLLQVREKYPPQTMAQLRRITYTLSPSDLGEDPIIRYWEDDEGKVGLPGTVYALAYMNSSGVINAMYSRAGGVSPEQRNVLRELQRRLAAEPGADAKKKASHEGTKKGT
jgi:hypothetical protein